MKKIKKMLIQWLGGETKEDVLEIAHSVSLLKQFEQIMTIRIYLDHLNGMSADDWSKNAYNLIKVMETTLTHELEDLGIGTEVVIKRVNEEFDINNENGEGDNR